MLTFAACLVLGATSRLLAQDDTHPVKWTLEVKNHSLRAGDRFTAEAVATIASGWHMYSITQRPGGPIPTSITVPESPSFALNGTISGPEPEKSFDPNFKMETEMYEDSANFEIPLLAKPNAWADSQLKVGVYFQTCNDHLCLPPSRVQLTASVKVIGGSAKTPGGSLSASTAPTSASTRQTASTATKPSPTESSDPALESSEPHPPTANKAIQPATNKAMAVSGGFAAVQEQNLGSFLWLAMAMGALSLLTPCVFPMIPITVSYFTNHAGMSRRSAVITALVYGIGIILTFTALGMLLAFVFGAGGVNQLAANPWVNLLITAIFLGFAFSLFGAYFIQVPPSIMSRLDSVTRSKEGVLGALLMGFMFTLTSFTCTAPFVGTLLVMTAEGNWRWPLAGMLAFSTVFAIPFFLLALAPQMMSRLPKAGNWMNSLKVVMGFVEVAAAMKFLSNADLVWRWGVFTRQVVLAAWIGIGVLTVLYILGYFRMEHDSPIESVSAARLMAAMVFLGVTIWLVPGLFGRQLGELESFLPPELVPIDPSTSAALSASLQHQTGWILNDYDGAIQEAKRENKLLFVDFTGYTCTNCRWMEVNMFPRPEVAKEMNKFVRARLYTDGDGELYARQQKMQQDKFGTVALPYYAILRADGTPVATFPGLTRNTNEFLAFLQSDPRQ